MNEQKNTILAFVLSALVLVAWWYFIDFPRQKQRQEDLQHQTQITQTQQPPGKAAAPGSSSAPVPGTTTQVPPSPGASAGTETKSREAAIASSPRVPIDTPSVKGSISLKGGRIDDVSLAQFHETVDPH